MAQKRTIDIDINTNADQAAKEFDDLGKATNRAAKSVDNLDATFEEVYGELQPLTTRMGEAEDRLYELALAGDTTSKEYQQLLEKVGQYRKVQIQTDLAVDGAATTLGQKLGSALTGVTSGFAATQGAMALFGSENEALEKTLVKVQAALAIQQGVKGLSDSYRELGGKTGIATKAQAALNFVMGLNPFVKAALAVTALIGVIQSLTGFMNPLIESFKDFSDWIGISSFAEDEAHEQTMQNLEEEKKAREDAFKVRQSQFDREIALMEALGKSSFELRQQKLEDSIAVQKQEAEAMQSTITLFETYAKAVGQNTGILDDLKNQLLEVNESIKDSENQLKINVIKNNREKAESNKKNAKENKQKKEEEIDFEIDAEIALQKELDKIKRANEDALRSDEENELLRLEEKYDVLEAMAFGNAEALNQIEIARLNARNEIFLKFDNEAYDAKKALDDKAAADKKARDEKEESNAKALADYKISVATQSLTAINDIAELFSKGSEKQAKRAFNVQKAVGIAQATINTAQAITKVFAETTDFTPTQSLRIANAVAIGVAGAAQVAAIASQTFEGGGGGDTPSVNASGGAAQAPSFNIVGNSSVNQLAQLQQQPVQAFVVSGEVTTSQALDRNRVENATL